MSSNWVENEFQFHPIRDFFPLLMMFQCFNWKTHERPNGGESQWIPSRVSMKFTIHFVTLNGLEAMRYWWASVVWDGRAWRAWQRIWLRWLQRAVWGGGGLRGDGPVERLWFGYLEISLISPICCINLQGTMPNLEVSWKPTDPESLLCE